MLKPRVEVPADMIRIVPREERLKRDAALRKPESAPPVWLAERVPVGKNGRPGRKTIEDGELAAQKELCTQILDVVCNSTFCDPEGVRAGRSHAPFVQARRFTAYIARNYLPKQIFYEIIASATGLGSKMAARQGYLTFEIKLKENSVLQAELTVILGKLRALGIIPPCQP